MFVNGWGRGGYLLCATVRMWGWESSLQRASSSNLPPQLDFEPFLSNNIKEFMSFCYEHLKEWVWRNLSLIKIGWHFGRFGGWQADRGWQTLGYICFKMASNLFLCLFFFFEKILIWSGSFHFCKFLKSQSYFTLISLKKLLSWWVYNHSSRSFLISFIKR